VSRVALCRADAVAEGAGRGFRLGEGTAQVAIFVIRWRGALRAYVNSCPHIGTPLDGLPDRFFDRSGGLLLCGTHGALFRPDDGFCVRGPCAGERLRPAEIALEGGTIILEMQPGGA
jgi:nitrite reductase/ring-hydroxylating ferredoxin subunit